MACPGHAVLGRVIPKTLRTTNLTRCKQRLSLGRSLGRPCPRRHALGMLSLAGSVPAPCERRTYTRKHNPNIFMQWGRELSQQWSSGEFRQTKVCNQKGQKGSTGRLGRAVNPASGYVSILFSNAPSYWFPVFPRESDRKLYCLVGCYVYFGVRTLDNTTAAPMWKLCSLGPVRHIFKSWTSFLVAVLKISFQLESFQNQRSQGASQHYTSNVHDDLSQAVKPIPRGRCVPTVMLKTSLVSLNHCCCFSWICFCSLVQLLGEVWWIVWNFVGKCLENGKAKVQRSFEKEMSSKIEQIR